MNYFVKTRNWHCKKWVKTMLDISQAWGVYRGDSYNDGDGKYCLDTNNYNKALFTYLYFKALYHFSGGMTYLYSTSQNKTIRGNFT